MTTPDGPDSGAQQPSEAALRAAGCKCKGHRHRPKMGNVFCFVTGCFCEIPYAARVRLGWEGTATIRCAYCLRTVEKSLLRTHQKNPKDCVPPDTKVAE